MSSSSSLEELRAAARTAETELRCARQGELKQMQDDIDRARSRVAELESARDRIVRPLQDAVRLANERLSQHIAAGLDGSGVMDRHIQVAVTDPQHPLFHKHGCIDSLYDRHGCPFISHQGHIHVLTKQGTTSVTVEACKMQGEAAPRVMWTREQRKVAYDWLVQTIAELASEPATSCPVAPLCMSVYRHPLPAPGDW
jgi:hypothetical protein